MSCCGRPLVSRSPPRLLHAAPELITATLLVLSQPTCEGIENRKKAHRGNPSEQETWRATVPSKPSSPAKTAPRGARRPRSRHGRTFLCLLHCEHSITCISTNGAHRVQTSSTEPRGSAMQFANAENILRPACMRAGCARVADPHRHRANQLARWRKDCRRSRPTLAASAA